MRLLGSTAMALDPPNHRHIVAGSNISNRLPIRRQALQTAIKLRRRHNTGHQD
jgi:hypothetical protein